MMSIESTDDSPVCDICGEQKAVLALETVGGNVSGSDLNDIYTALGELEGAINIINDRVRGTNDPSHDWVKYARISLSRGRVAYKNLEREQKERRP